MSRSGSPCVGKRLAAAMALLIVFLVLPEASRAQNVCGTSEILPSATAGKIDAYAATEVDYYVWYYYAGFYVNAYLCQTTTQITTIYNGACPGNSQIDSGTSLGLPYYYDSHTQLYISGGSLLDSYTVGDFYTLISWHYLQAYYIVSLGYYDPGGFGSTSASLLGSTDPSGTNFPGNCLVACTPEYVAVADILAGLTDYEVSSAAPQISSINPGGASVGSSGTIQLQGTNLVDSFGDPTTANISNSSGITYSVASQSPTQVDLSYSIATGATTGTHNITLSTYFGQSNAVSFNVGDPTPVVTGVNPDIWPAGASNLTVTITGKGFGTNPSVSVSSSYVTVGATSNPTDTSVQVSISVSSSAPNQTVTVSVQSGGYNGNGFIATTQGQSSTGSNTAQLQATAAATPQIMYFGGQNCGGGTNITSTTTSVIDGQEISLCASYTVPSGASVTSQSWSQPPGTVVSGYSASVASASVTQFQLPNNSNNLKFYWLDSGNSRTISYSYTLSNGQSATANATFNVNEPSNVTVALTPGQVSVIGVPHVDNGTGDADIPLLEDGGSGGPGMRFQASATSIPAGSYQWVQLIVSDQNSLVGGGGKTTPFNSIAGAPELDKTYPYGYPYLPPPAGPGTVTTTNVANDTATDSPNTDLVDNFGEMARSFTAIMYLEWLPTADNRCTDGSACTIPAPLGSVQWQWAGDAINTLQPEVNNGVQYHLWIINCGTNPMPNFQQGGSLPAWSAHN